MAEIIRPLCEKDLPDLIRIEHSCFQSPWSEKQLSQALVNHRSRVLGVFQNGAEAEELVGFAIFTVLMDEAELLQIGVAPQMQRQGVAKTLLFHAFGVLKQETISRVLLEVRQSNLSARRLYKTLGFQVDGLRKAYYPPLVPGEPKEEAILMSYALPE